MKPLTLALISMEPDEVTAFRKVFGRLRSGLHADWRLLDDGEESAADLCVVAVDSIYGHMDWLRLTGSGMRTAVFTSAQYSRESDLVVRQPLAADNLAQVLQAVAAEHGLGGSAPEPLAQPPATEPSSEAAEDVDFGDAVPELVELERQTSASAPAVEPASVAPPASNPASIPEADAKPKVKVKAEVKLPSVQVPDVEPTAVQPAPVASPPTGSEDAMASAKPPPATIGAWLRDAGSRQAVSITAAGEVWSLDPDRDVYYGPTVLKPLAPMLEAPSTSLRELDVLTLEQVRRGSAQPLARLRWFAGLLASPGELAPGFDAVGKFKLRRWPQIEREYPRHFRIATAMLKDWGTLAELATTSGAPQADVIDFINACQAIGIIDYDSGDDAPAAPRRGRVMSRLRNPLGR